MLGRLECGWQRALAQIVGAQLELRVIGETDTQGTLHERFAQTSLEGQDIADLDVGRDYSR